MQSSDMGRGRAATWFSGVFMVVVVMFAFSAVSLRAQQSSERVDVLIGFTTPPGPSQQALVRAFGGNIKYTYTLVPAIAANVPQAAMEALSRNPNVTNVDLDGTVVASDLASELADTWGVNRIGAGSVHFTHTGSGVRVGVIDSGVDCTHPDLAANCLPGFDFVNNDADPDDDNGHGTHVAGTVAAKRDMIGVVGAAPGASIVPIKVLGKQGSGQWSDIIAALQWAADNDIDVTNNSYGSSGDPGSTVEQAFINSASAGSGMVHVAAAGNQTHPVFSCGQTGFPAAYASVISVGATTASDQKAFWSCPSDELWAPGDDINSTLAGGGYGEKDGTSMASPHVAGVAALVISACPGPVGAGNVRERLNVAETVPVGSLVDAEAAVLACGSCIIAAETCVGGSDDDCDGFIDCADADCSADAACSSCVATEVPETSCTDFVDNDCDGLTDAFDLLDCCLEDPIEVTCNDGLDNDCDGLTDGGDPDCPADDCVNPGKALPGIECVDPIECCSNKCKGRTGAKTCK